MFLFLDSSDRNTHDLQKAAQQLKRGLRGLLRPISPSFQVEFDSLPLARDSSKAFALLLRSPRVHDRLQDYLNCFSAGHGLFGDVNASPRSRPYQCPEGHIVNVSPNDRLRWERGQPLCPTHKKRMSPV